MRLLSCVLPCSHAGTACLSLWKGAKANLGALFTIFTALICLQNGIRFSVPFFRMNTQKERGISVLIYAPIKEGPSTKVECKMVPVKKVLEDPLLEGLWRVLLYPFPEHFSWTLEQL